ncbi:tRNA-dihydrouridine synthase family protein [bacterium]|nr:tRNA-dihydrouridine synthase family protein [bacterium]PJA73876.1 MAG: tRNA dihydrouridine synthase DusB [bacterium CG_4_9_14_3_um_filter_65_15]
MVESERRDFFRRVVAMSPMATGGNLPYRRLCREYGAVRTCSEMVLAHKLVKGGERTLLRHHPEETDFGVQLAGKHPEVMAEAAVIGVESGAAFIDLNFGCPIDLVVRKGMGAALLRRPTKLVEVVAAVREAVDVPLSVKIRLGYSQKELNCVQVALRVEEAGADAIGIHGRTRNQRYRMSADWALIDEVARAVSLPVLGNGDLLTCWDLERRRRETCVESFLVARGALVKPWVFAELHEGRPLDPQPVERWSMMRRYLDLAREHFGDDEQGMTRVRRFFLWHLGFWNRYYPWQEEDFLRTAPESLLQARNPHPPDDPQWQLLASAEEADHERIWERLLAGEHPVV